MAKYLVNPETILKALERERPNLPIRKICKTIGDDRAFLLLELFQGQHIYFPSRQTLININKSEYIQAELKKIKDKSDFAEKVKKISRMLSMSRSAVIKTFVGKKYHE
jgi:hypothetical protein